MYTIFPLFYKSAKRLRKLEEQKVEIKVKEPFRRTLVEKCISSEIFTI